MTYKQILRRRAKKANSTKILGQLSPYDIVIAPIFTEKAVAQGENMNKYYFKVNARANKNDVKRAIEFIYNVEVAKVNTKIVAHKGRAMRKTVRRSHKVAIVTLPKEQKIEIAG